MTAALKDCCTGRVLKGRTFEKALRLSSSSGTDSRKAIQGKEQGRGQERGLLMRSTEKGGKEPGRKEGRERRGEENISNCDKIFWERNPNI